MAKNGDGYLKTVSIKYGIKTFCNNFRNITSVYIFNLRASINRILPHMYSIKIIEQFCALPKTNNIIKGLDDTNITKSYQNQIIKFLWEDIIYVNIDDKFIVTYNKYVKWLVNQAGVFFLKTYLCLKWKCYRVHLENFHSKI